MEGEKQKERRQDGGSHERKRQERVKQEEGIE
jgi:hypothetical protein